VTGAAAARNQHPRMETTTMRRKAKESGSIFDALDADDEFEAELKRNAALPVEKKRARFASLKDSKGTKYKLPSTFPIDDWHNTRAAPFFGKFYRDDD
jgi:hypothetical protein